MDQALVEVSVNQEAPRQARSIAVFNVKFCRVMKLPVEIPKEEEKSVQVNGKSTVWYPAVRQLAPELIQCKVDLVMFFVSL